MKNISKKLYSYLIVLFLVMNIYVPIAQANLLNHNYQINAIDAGTIGVSTIVDVINPGVVISCASPTSVGPDCGLNVNNGAYSVTFNDSDIIINTSASSSGHYSQNDFITFSIVDPGYIFSSASLKSTNIPGLTSQNVTFTATTVTLNLSSLTSPAVQSTDLSVQVVTGFPQGTQISTYNPPGVLLSISDSSYNDFSVSNFGTIDISYLGTVLNDLGGIIQNSGIIDSFGIVENKGVVNNSSMMANEFGALLGNVANGLIDNSGTMQNLGTMQNNGTVQNFSAIINGINGSVLNMGPMNNSGSIQNLSSLSNELDGALNNLANGIIENMSSGNVNNTGTINQQGSFLNSGSVTNNANATINNQNGGLIINSGTLQNNGSINNSGSITNSGNLIINSNASITGNGTYNQTSGQTTVMGELNASLITITNSLMQINNQAKVVINQIP